MGAFQGLDHVELFRRNTFFVILITKNFLYSSIFEHVTQNDVTILPYDNNLKNVME